MTTTFFLIIISSFLIIFLGKHQLINDGDSISLQYRKERLYTHFMPQFDLFSNSDNCLLAIIKVLHNLWGCSQICDLVYKFKNTLFQNGNVSPHLDSTSYWLDMWEQSSLILIVSHLWSRRSVAFQVCGRTYLEFWICHLLIRAVATNGLIKMSITFKNYMDAQTAYTKPKIQLRRNRYQQQKMPSYQEEYLQL